MVWTNSFCPSSNLRNQDFWTVLWKQLEIFEIELAYDEKIFQENTMKSPRCAIWLQILFIEFGTLRILEPIKKRYLGYSIGFVYNWSDDENDYETSKVFLNLLNILDGFHPLELHPNILEIIKVMLHPDALDEIIYKISHGEFVMMLSWMHRKFLIARISFTCWGTKEAMDLVIKTNRKMSRSLDIWIISRPVISFLL